MTTNPELKSAIERNQRWIETKCRLSERNASKCEELINDVFYNLLDSNKNFITKETVNADAWVKRITLNVTASFKKRQKDEKEVISENVDNIEPTQDSNVEAKFDFRVAINYIENNMKSRDSEIMFLYLMEEPHSSIAEIIGLEVSTVTNIISARKKELNEYLNKGQV